VMVSMMECFMRPLDARLAFQSSQQNGREIAISRWLHDR
jgi:hypothetical protein